MNKMPHRQRNIFRAFPQGRCADWKHVEPVIQIAAKLVLEDHAFQVSMGGSDDAHVHFLRSRAAQAFEFTLLQYTQQLGLPLQRNITDLVQGARLARICRESKPLITRRRLLLLSVLLS
jgi:hypothetical protein